MVIAPSAMVMRTGVSGLVAGPVITPPLLIRKLPVAR
jgi:hypothetical protein